MKLNTLLASLFMSIIAHTSVLAQYATPVKLLHPAGAANDQLGISVAVDGDTMVVGAELDDVGINTDQGSASVYRWTGTTWAFEAILTASNGVGFDFFGSAVAISCDTIVVGARQANINGTPLQGAAYVFTRNGTTWTQQARLVATDGAGFDFLGKSVAIDGDTIVAGAPGKDNGANGDQGAAFVFTRSGSVWTQQAKLLSADGAVGDYFGFCVAISGNTIAAGAPLDAFGSSMYQGSAYIFTRGGSSWSQSQKLIPDDGATNDVFGWSVAISGNTVVASAHLHDLAANIDQGQAYVFTRSAFNGPWTQQARIVKPGGTANDQFAFSVAISGETIAIGVPANDTHGLANSGSVQVFTRNGSTWSFQTQLFAPDGFDGDQLGYAVALSGDTAVGGAPYHNLGSAVDPGSAWAFSRIGSIWTGPAQQLQTQSPAAFDQAGASVSISGNTAVVGAPSNPPGYPALGAGYVTVYVRTGPGAPWVQQARLAASDPVISSQFGAAVAISGDTLAVGAPYRGAGAVYIFTRSGGAWTERVRLDPGLDGGSQFGSAVAMWNGNLIVGKGWGYGGSSIMGGSVHLFRGSGATWQRYQILAPTNGTTQGFFGCSVSVADGLLAVGTMFEGAVYMYRYDAGVQGFFLERRIQSPSANFVYFGMCVSVSGDAVAIAGGYENSTAYVFSHIPGGSNWFQEAAIPVGRYPIAVAYSGNTLLVVDQPLFFDRSSGAVGVCSRSGGTWSFQNRVLAPQDGFFDSIAVSGNTILAGTRYRAIGGLQQAGGAWSFDSFDSFQFGDATGTAVNVSTSALYHSLQEAITPALNNHQIRASEPAWSNASTINTTDRSLNFTSLGDIRTAPGSSFTIAAATSLTAPPGNVIEINGSFAANGVNTLTSDAFRLGSRGTLTLGPDFSLIIAAPEAEFQGSCSIASGSSLLLNAASTAFTQHASLLAPVPGTTVRCAGSFDCRIDSNARFDMASAILRLTSSGTLEAMSTDIGPDPAGLDRTAPGRFPIGMLTIRSSSTVQPVDARDNDARGQSECEAIYVNILTIEPGARLANSGCIKIYYNFLNNSGTVDAPANLIQLSSPCLADFNHDAVVDFFDYLDFVAAFASNSITADFNSDGVVDFFDYLDFVQAFSTGC